MVSRSRLIATLGVVGLPAALAVYLYRRSLPRLDGVIRAPGLEAPVEILRDRWGVPHIYARNLYDLFFAQGYAHAQDRLWQMEINRRLGHGRLAELLGFAAFPIDQLIRTIGIPRAAQTDLSVLSSKTLRALEAYADGVNTFIEGNSHHLPLEFALLRIKPEPWQPLDSLVWSKVMAWALSSNWVVEMLHAALIDRLGAERASQLLRQYSVDNPIVIHEQTVADLVKAVLEQFRAAEYWLPIGGLSGMSNNWVVDGAKSATGKPLLANDPHLSLQMPSIWYENHLVSPELQATGVSFPGVPYVVLGHNAEIAWGMTASMADVQDLYVERLNPSNSTQYEYQGCWEQAEVVREEIAVKGESTPRVIEIIITRHGPIISQLSPILASQPCTAIALKWVGQEASRMADAFLELNQATDWKTFCEALRHWDAPSVSIVYADRVGNIGFYMPGKVPIRGKGLGVVPVPGWTGEHDWLGWVAHEELPHCFNPPQHYLASANNEVVGEEYRYFLTGSTLNGFRARRIVELLVEKEKLTLDDFARIQLDQFSAPAETFCQLLTMLKPFIMNQPVLGDIQDKAERALDTVAGWDHVLTPGSVAGAIFELTQHFAMHRVFGPWLGELTDHYIGIGVHPLLGPVISSFLDGSPLVLQRMLVNDERDWFKDDEDNRLTREDILAHALRDAIDYLQKTVGDDMTQWEWGRLHQASFTHAFGTKRPFDRIFNRGPYALGGDANTVWQAAFVPKLPFHKQSNFSATWRQIIDLSAWDASLGVHTTGQSGHPASKHYDDMISLWLKGGYHPLLWTRGKVEEAVEATLRLIP